MVSGLVSGGPVSLVYGFICQLDEIIVRTTSG